MPFAQKYRPKFFYEMTGQSFVRICLTTALKENILAGAYLFCGPRGTGKTSCARILAKALNCVNIEKNQGEPCGKCEMCVLYEQEKMLDVIEIDAASHTGVDNIREIIEHAKFHPSHAQYKVYIVDEVHMLSKGAFNALLKTLEEPPEHIKFVLATTEYHKVPETILSRTQTYFFRMLSSEEIIHNLHQIAKKEDIQTEEKALEVIARHARGGMRDAIQLFEQHILDKKLETKFVHDHLGLCTHEILKEFLNILTRKDTSKLLLFLEKHKQNIFRIDLFLEQVLFFIRDTLLEQIKKQNQDQTNNSIYFHIFSLLENIYKKIKTTPDPFLLLEIMLIEYCDPFSSLTSTSVPSPHITSPPTSLLFGEKRNNKTEEEKNKKQKTENRNIFEENMGETQDFLENTFKNIPEEHISKKQKITETTKKTPEVRKKTEKQKNIEKQHSDVSFDVHKFLAHMKKIPGKAFIAMSMQISQVEFSNEKNRLFLTPKSEFHEKKLSPPAIRDFIAHEFYTCFGVRITIEVFPFGSSSFLEPPSDDLLSAAQNIF